MYILLLFYFFSLAFLLSLWISMCVCVFHRVKSQSTVSFSNSRFPLMMSDVCRSSAHENNDVNNNNNIKFSSIPVEKNTIRVFLCTSVCNSSKLFKVWYKEKCVDFSLDAHAHQHHNVCMYIYFTESQSVGLSFFWKLTADSVLIEDKVEAEKHKVQLIFFSYYYICCSSLCCCCRRSNSRTKYFHWNISLK